MTTVGANDPPLPPEPMVNDVATIFASAMVSTRPSDRLPGHCELRPAVSLAQDLWHEETDGAHHESSQGGLYVGRGTKLFEDVLFHSVQRVQVNNTDQGAKHAEQDVKWQLKDMLEL